MTAPSPSPHQRYEEHHEAWLHPAAVREQDSAGRKHVEEEHPYRTCFQRDRDRIVHCSAFRRLDFKTQVFVPHEHDHFRTRMTHTLEVAQIGRTIGRALRLNEDLIEAVALAHDLGHPPFGHGGEEVLDGLMAAHGGFEHNRQALRVVDHLEHPYPTFRGLNLTTVVRECLAKHRTRYDTPVCPEFDPALRPPLEGQLVDLADEIAYTAADLEDALAAGVIAQEQLQDLTLWRDAWQTAQREYPAAAAHHQRIRACKAVLAAMADDAVATSAERLDRLNPRTVQAVREAQRIVAFSEELAPAVRQLQDFLMQQVYLRGENADRDRQAAQIIRELFAAYLADPSLLPPRYQRLIDADSALRSATQSTSGLYRVACDYIAGMTDRFCRQEHAKVCGDRSPPVGTP
ncbi:MAG: deoxyguanosinetriphosphate triphosphohydrolase [Phycisphaerae bacterium]|nr:deoxyguanosinetriphosphate triphosphohydrolase [Phycisphaerae bacterium]